VKVVPRFFPLFVTAPVTPAFESAGGGEPETLDPSSTGTERLILCLATETLSTGIATGPVGARLEADRSVPGSDTDGDMDCEAREPSAVAVVCSATGLGDLTLASSEKKKGKEVVTLDGLRHRVRR
jgi:hypothetical protein